MSVEFSTKFFLFPMNNSSLLIRFHLTTSSQPNHIDIFMIFKHIPYSHPIVYLYCNRIMDIALSRSISTQMDKMILPPDFNSRNLNESQKSLSHHCPKKKIPLLHSYVNLTNEPIQSFFENSRLQITIYTISR